MRVSQNQSQSVRQSGTFSRKKSSVSRRSIKAGDQGIRSPTRIVNKQGEVKATFNYLSKQVSNSTMRALEHLMPLTGEAKLTQEQAHVAHHHWIERI